MDLRQIDLNLLVIFNQLLRDRRVSSTAEKLGLSQPAVSNALKRLRVLLKDDLFVRTSRGMEPTPYAMHLIEPHRRSGQPVAQPGTIGAHGGGIVPAARAQVEATPV